MTEYPLPPQLLWLDIPLIRIGQTSISASGILGFVLTVLAAVFFSFIIRKAIFRGLDRGAHSSSGLAYSLSRFLNYAILSVGLVLAFQGLGFELSTLSVILGFFSVGVGFGLQNVTSNFVSGLILLVERPLKVGDTITVENQMAVVQSINMRSTLVRTLDNIDMIIPNSRLVEHPVINWSHKNPEVRLHIPVGAAYGSDPEKVCTALMGVAASHAEVLKKPSPEVRLLNFGDSALHFELLAWISQPQEEGRIRSELNYKISGAFREVGLRIPFPQRDVHLHSPDKI